MSLCHIPQYEKQAHCKPAHPHIFPLFVKTYFFVEGEEKHWNECNAVDHPIKGFGLEQTYGKHLGDFDCKGTVVDVGDGQMDNHQGDNQNAQRYYEYVFTLVDSYSNGNGCLMFLRQFYYKLSTATCKRLKVDLSTKKFYSLLGHGQT